MNSEKLTAQIEEKGFKNTTREFVYNYMPVINDELEDVMDHVHKLGLIDSIAQTIVGVVLLLWKMPKWKEMNNGTFIKEFTEVAQANMRKELTFEHLAELRVELENELTEQDYKEHLAIKIIGLATGNYDDFESGEKYNNITKEQLASMRKCICTLDDTTTNM